MVACQAQAYCLASSPPTHLKAPNPFPWASYQHGCTRQPGASRCSQTLMCHPLGCRTWWSGAVGLRRLTIKIVFLMLKNEVGRGGQDQRGMALVGSAPPPHWSKTRLAFSSWGVCVPMCMPLCVQNMDGRCGRPLGSEMTSGKPQSAHPGVERTASGVLSRAHPGLSPPTGHGCPSLL